MVTLKGYTANMLGVSTDQKPTDAEVNTIFRELNTNKYYYFDGTTWNEIPSSGGGSSFEPTQTQLDAMNSGATTEKINQISTNESNILNCVKVHSNIIGLDGNCDANSVDDNTLYRLQTNNVTNFPADYPTTAAVHYIVTIKNTSGQGAQRYQYIYNNEMKTKWRRSQFQNNWSAWTNVITGNIECGTGKQYTTLREAVAAGVQNGGTVIVYPGVYDLTQEFSAEIAAATGEQKGIQLTNGVHVKFMSGAYVTAIFDGTSSWVYDHFSPFYASGSFTLENANISAQNCRYCVHDEMGGVTSAYSSKYINCTMDYKNTINAVKYVQCIGGGLGKNGHIIINGGIYSSSTVAGYGTYGTYGTAENCQQPISYHNANLSNTDSNIIISNVYLADRGYFRFGNRGTSTKMSNVIINNCSMGLPILDMYETTGDSTKNLKYTLFGNISRNNAVGFDFSRVIGEYENGIYPTT